MEHAVYICSWSRSRSGFRLWIKSRPHICAEGATYSEAEERFIRVIREAGGAIQAVMEFDPPLPKSALETKYSTPEIYRIVGDDRFETTVRRARPYATEDEVGDYLRTLDEFYQSPVCRKCQHPASARSDKPLTLTYAPSRYDGAFGAVGDGPGAMVQVFSEEFLGLLKSEERERLRFRPVIRNARARRFYELLGPEGPPEIAVAGLELAGWRCSHCNYRTWGYWVKGLSINSFVSRSDLPPFLPGVFTIGAPPEVELAVTAERWKEMVGRKGTRGVTSRQIGVVPDHKVIRVPELKTYEERRMESRRG